MLRVPPHWYRADFVLNRDPCANRKGASTLKHPDGFPGWYKSIYRARSGVIIKESLLRDWYNRRVFKQPSLPFLGAARRMSYLEAYPERASPIVGFAPWTRQEHPQVSATFALCGDHPEKTEHG